jgi:hypothetical protein
MQMPIDKELIMEAELERLRRRLIQRHRDARSVVPKSVPRFPTEPFFKNPPKPHRGIWIMKSGGKKDGE